MNNLIILIYSYSKILSMFLISLIFINIASLILVLIDKHKAKHNQWRIKELTFLILSIIGGSIGVLLGMVIFRHKTNKKKFYIGIPTIFLFNIIMFYVILNLIIK